MDTYILSIFAYGFIFLIIGAFFALDFACTVQEKLTSFCIDCICSIRLPRITWQSFNLKQEWLDATIEARLEYSAGIAVLTVICIGILTQ